MLFNLQAKNPSPDTILRDAPQADKFRHLSFARRPLVTVFGLGSLACMLIVFSLPGTVTRQRVKSSSIQSIYLFIQLIKMSQMDTSHTVLFMVIDADEEF